MENALAWLTDHHSVPGWAILILAGPLLEHWLARTDRVRANSGIELVGNLLVRLGLTKLPVVSALVSALATPPEQKTLPETAGELAKAAEKKEEVR